MKFKQLALPLLFLFFIALTASGCEEPEQSFETGVTVKGRVIDWEGNPVRATVKVFQDFGGGRAGSGNYWNIPGWETPETRTDEEGCFVITGLKDYPELKTHQYYIMILPDHSHRAEPAGRWLPIDKLKDGEVVDLGLISVGKKIAY